VEGAQALATAGAEVSKIRIFARHSGDAILRYVAEAPLTSLRHDLGKFTASTKGSAGESKVVKDLMLQLKTLSQKVEAHEIAVGALVNFTREHRVISYVQNLETMAVHGLRSGDSSSTICGFDVGPRRIKRGVLKFLPGIIGECWENLCERCLRPEREAAIVLERVAVDKLANTPSKQFLDQ